jgi:predicted Zn-dependent protease
MMRLVLPALLLPVLLGGCISERREAEIGAQMAAELNPHLPLVHDPLLNGFISRVGGRLGQISERPALEYRFYIVNTDAVNAFALPGGHIYLTRGLIEQARDGPEFASVLAHEIGHVAARHGALKLQRHLRTGSLVSALYNTILGGEPALLRENSLEIAGEVWSASYSRHDEEEADELAVRYLLRAGLDPHGMVTLLQKLLEQEYSPGGTDPSNEWLSSHPLTSHRIAAAQADIERLRGETDPVLQLSVDAFPIFRMLVSQQAIADPVEPGS